MEINKAQELVMAYPAQVGSSSAYVHQPAAGYPSASGAGYGYPPWPQYGAYLQQPSPLGYAYPPPQPCYGCSALIQPPQQPKKKKWFGFGWLAGLCGKALSEVLAHEISDEYLGGGFGGGGCGGGGCGGGF